MNYFTEINPKFRLPDEVWDRLNCVLPEPVPKPKGGRPRMPDRQALDAIVYVLRTGCQWKALPRCLGAASTVHDRFQEWVEAGVFLRLWEEGLKQYAEEVGIEWEWNSMDGAMVKAPLGGKETGRNPTDRGKSGTKRSLLTDGNGIPLAIVVAGANRHDMKLMEATLEAQVLVPSDPETGESFHLCLDKGYDFKEIHEIVKVWGYVGHIPKRGEEKKEILNLPNYRARRWVVERTHSWINRNRRLLIRWEKRPENYLAMLHLAFASIVVRAIQVFG
jgi:putative transposase